MMKTLTICNIEQTIDTVCSEYICHSNDSINHQTSKKNDSDNNSYCWIVQRWINDNIDKNNNNQSNSSETTNTLLYGIIISTPPSSSLSSVPGTGTSNENASLSIIATFYIGYSTWDGRILYVDTISTRHNNTDSNGLALDVVDLESNVQKEALLKIRIVLSRIAVQLDCLRFTWQHYNINDPLYQLNDTAIPPPSTLKEWITLHWSQESIAKYISNPIIVQQIQNYLNEQQQSLSRNDNNSNADNTNKTSNKNQHYTSLHNKINYALNVHQQYSTILSNRNSNPKKKSIVKLRLATTDNDCTNICRLVQQLAIYEKEEHAVHIGKEQYTIDGFLSSIQNDTTITQNNNNDTGTPLPLFFCLLLVEEVIGSTTNTIESEHVFGMAFCYIGYKRISNSATSTNTIQSFVYLEDFYIEESYRKYGYGTYTMECLGIITLILQSYCMVWSALDWNTNAIQFYTNKIGACIQSNLYTTRYDTTNLSSFVQATNNKNNKQNG